MCCSCCVAVAGNPLLVPASHAHSFTATCITVHAGAKQLKAVMSEGSVGADMQRSVSAPVDTSSKPSADNGEDDDEVLISAHDTAGKGRQKQKRGG